MSITIVIKPVLAWLLTRLFLEKNIRLIFCLDEVDERKLENIELIEATLEKIKIIRDRLKVAQD